MSERRIAPTVIIHPNVELGNGVVVEDYCIIGCPPHGLEGPNPKTIIGNDSLIRSHTVIYAGNNIGHHFMTGNRVNIRENNRIGNHVSIGTASVVEHHVVIEDEVRLHSMVFVPEYCELRRGSWIGPHTTLTNARYPKSRDVKDTLQGVTLEPDAKVGAGCTLLPGVRIGKNALVGAGSVVTKDVPDNSVAFGTPATVTGSIETLPY